MSSQPGSAAPPETATPDHPGEYAKVAAAEDHFLSAIELGEQIPWIASPDGSVEQASPRWLALTGMSPDEARGNGWARAVHADELTVTLERWAAARANGQPFEVEHRILSRDGTYRWFRTRASPKRDGSRRIVRWYGTLEDIDERRQMLTALQTSERRLRFALDVGRLGAWEYEVATGRITASDLCAQCFGLHWGSEIAHYHAVLAATHADDRAALNSEKDAVLASGRPLDIEFRVVWPDGTVHWVRVTGRVLAEDGGTPRQAFGLITDVTEQLRERGERARAEARLVHLAYHDALTDLPNRHLWNDRLTGALARVTPHAMLAVLIINLDQFKATNDQLGHKIGDRVLQHAAACLMECASPPDIVARRSGDEFAVLQTGISGPAQAEALSRRLLHRLALPVTLDGHVVMLGASVGISIAPQDAAEPQQLQRNAEAALDRAKAEGRNRFCFFEAEMDAQTQAREALKPGLRDAVEREELRLVYQPIIDLRTGRIAAFEALLRWQHPQRGLILPGDFIAVAEETGWVDAFGRWALRRACLQATTWPHDIRVAVNLSVLQFGRGLLERDVAAALAEAGLPADRLELEVTETLLLRATDANSATLAGLRAMGVRLALDDFGTGYSSLAYLRRFPFDKIKVDRSLVSDLPDGDGGDSIVRAIVGLGRSLDIPVTAEGVERPEQLAFLSETGCAQAQGFLFSRPVPAAQIAGLLDRSWPT